MHPLRAKANCAELLERADGEAANLAQAVSYLWRGVPCPVVAAVHGACFGGGLQIALGADVRVAAEDAKLSVMWAKWGLVPDMGATAALRELTRRDVALEFARRVAKGSPDAAAAAKQLWHAAYDAGAGEPAERELLRLETVLQERLLGG